MAVYFPLTKSHKEGLLLHSHTQLLSSNIMGYRMHQDKEYTRQGRAEQRRVRAWRVGLNKFEQHKMFIEAEWQWSERSCKVFWSRVFWSRVVFKEVQRVTWGSHTTGSSFAPGAAAQPPVCLALFSLWTLLHMYFTWYPQSAYTMARRLHSCFGLFGFYYDYEMKNIWFMVVSQFYIWRQSSTINSA